MLGDAGGQQVCFHGHTVWIHGWFTEALAKDRFQKKYSRFQLRLLREGDSSELQDGESLTPPLDLQLILMRQHLPRDEERDEKFFESCSKGRSEEVEQSL